MNNSVLDRLNCTCVIIKVRHTIGLVLPQGKLWGEAGAMEVNGHKELPTQLQLAVSNSCKS